MVDFNDPIERLHNAQGGCDEEIQLFNPFVPLVFSLINDASIFKTDFDQSGVGDACEVGQDLDG